MTPVINPLWFWLMSFVDDLQFILIAASLLGFIALVIYCFFAFVDSMDSDDFIVYMKKGKRPVVWLLSALLAVAIIPSSETIIKMMVAQNVTYERVEAVGDTVETVYNDIMALFEDKGETE